MLIDYYLTYVQQCSTASVIPLVKYQSLIAMSKYHRVSSTTGLCLKRGYPQIQWCLIILGSMLLQRMLPSSKLTQTLQIAKIQWELIFQLPNTRQGFPMAGSWISRPAMLDDISNRVSFIIIYTMWGHLSTITMVITTINPSYCSYKLTQLSWGAHIVRIYSHFIPLYPDKTWI